jgi:7-cyano-7-deazaguanine synthase
MELSKPKILIVSSGGMDSTTLIYEMSDGVNEISTISFNYGQRHKKELVYAAATARKLGLRHHVVDLSGLTPILAESGSSLVSTEEVPEGHYAEANMKKTVVPNRNMMMLSIAGSVAVATGCQWVYTGVHAGDHAVYPDCRPIFIHSVSQALVQGNVGFGDLRGVLAPYVNISKAEIAKKAILLKVPFEETWSCYKGGENHCGRCGTCVERLEAIDQAEYMLLEENSLPDNFEDGTLYEDVEFWETATN